MHDSFRLGEGGQGAEGCVPEPDHVNVCQEWETRHMKLATRLSKQGSGFAMQCVLLGHVLHAASAHGSKVARSR